MIYNYSCVVCEREFEKWNTISNRKDAFCCGVRAQKHICTQPIVMKDRLFEFTGDFKGERIDVNSKCHYKRILKDKGLVDVSVSEVKSVREKQDNMTPKHDVGKMEQRIKNKVAKDGLTKHLNPFLDKCTQPT